MDRPILSILDLLDPSVAKRRFLLKTQVSLERGSTNELLEVILLDPSDAKRRFLMKKEVSLERGSKKGGEGWAADYHRITTGLPPDYHRMAIVVGPL